MNACSTHSGRFAPSPTGAQHLGNARTYLLAWLAARSAGGKILLRVEDVDLPRVKPWARQQAVDDLAWLGLNWDEGPDIGGPHEPYVQTERLEGYRAALSQLIEAGRAYPCVCSRKDIARASSAPHLEHEGPVYPGTCAHWQPGDPLPDPGTFCWRFRVSNQVRTFDDVCEGRQTIDIATKLGDFPLTQKTGQVSYQLAVVVDDGSMGINYVVRGNDLIPSTFRQLELFEAFDWPHPQYAHVPLVVGSDNRRLAKRHGDTKLQTYRQVGVPPQRIIGWAGWSAGVIDRWDPVAPEDLVGHFNIEQLTREPAVVDKETETQILRR